MPDVIKIACPNCAKAMAVPATMAGKKIKCKNCETVFPVKPAGDDPAATLQLADEPKKAKPVKPKKATAAPPPAAPAGPPRSPAAQKLADEFDIDGNPYGLTNLGDEVPRCPFCAVELDPPDTKVCMSCGFNLLERRRHYSTKVYQLTFADYLKYHIPTIASVVAAALLMTVIGVVYTKMADWFHGGLDFLEMDETDENTGKKKTYIPSGACVLFIFLPCAYLTWLALRFVFRRLVFRFRPPEVQKKTK